MVTARTIPVEESPNSQQGNHQGPGITKWFLGPKWLQSKELCDFSMGIGSSCAHPMIHEIKSHWVLRNCAIPNIPFLQ